MNLIWIGVCVDRFLRNTENKLERVVFTHKWADVEWIDSINREMNASDLFTQQ